MTRGAIALLVTMALAGVANAQSDKDPATEAADRQALKAYPAAALAQHVQGLVELDCGRNEHNALRNCHVAYETPQGYGFGQAALKLAGRSVDNPAVNVEPTASGERERVRFCLDPSAIMPNDLLPRHVIVSVNVTGRPTLQDVLEVTPSEAITHGISGEVLLSCRVSADGVVGPCHARSEQPQGYGLGAAAEKLAGKFRATPELMDGAPHPGSFTVPIYFGSAPIPPPPRPSIGWMCSFRG